MQLSADTIGAIKNKSVNNSPTLEGAQKNNANKNYDDPLNKWPIRGLAYSNELGAAISEVAPTLGTLLWFPAMLYFGADIYDKYKNDKTSYDPNSKRGTKQAVFQLLASVILPTGAVLAGQKIASAMGALRKNGITLQAEEDLTNFTFRFIERRNLNKYKNDIPQFKTEYFSALENKVADATRTKMLKNPINKIVDKLAGKYEDNTTSIIGNFFKKHSSTATSKKRLNKLRPVAEKQIDKIFELEDLLSKNIQPKDFSSKMFAKFQKSKILLKKDPEFSANHLGYAIKDAIKAFQKTKISKQKWLKTLGGFIALGVAIKPIDNFVEHVVIKKVVEPGLTMLDDHNFKKLLND